jgi:hypothetical protein
MDTHYFYILTLDDINKENMKNIIAALVALDDSGIDYTLNKLPAIYGYIAMLMAEAKHNMDLAEVELEQQEAQLRKEIRENMKKQGAKITEKTLDAEVIVAPGYIVKRVEALDATTKYNLVRNLLTTIEYKKDMAIQISANTRNEKKLYSA